MLLMIDNYDSFTYNLVQYFGELGEDVRVVRNDAADVAALAAMHPDRVCVSPGPCSPKEAGEALRRSNILPGRSRFSECVWGIRQSARHSGARLCAPSASCTERPM